MERKSWGTAAGRQVELFTLELGQGHRALITNYGAALVSLYARDSRGELADVVLNTTAWKNTSRIPSTSELWWGATPTASGAQFSLGGRCTNCGQRRPEPHPRRARRLGRGGMRRSQPPPAALKLSYFSPDGEGLSRQPPGGSDSPEPAQGPAPGLLRHLRSDTILNLTNHAYFNLADKGQANQTMSFSFADFFTPTDAESLPTGRFSRLPDLIQGPHPIGARIDADFDQLRFAGGYDHNWVLRRTGSGLALAARVEHAPTGRVMEVLTTKPGIQFYTGNYLDGVAGKGGAKYEWRGGFCLETQFFPDSPHQAHFPCPILRAGERYAHSTIYQFSTK